MNGFCEYCQTEGAIGKDVFLEEQFGDIKIYICAKCDDERIRDYEEDWLNNACNCSQYEANCTHPLCEGYWT